MNAQLVLSNKLLFVEVGKVNALDLYEGPRPVKPEIFITRYFDQIPLFQVSSAFWINFAQFGTLTKPESDFNCDHNFVDKSVLA